METLVVDLEQINEKEGFATLVSEAEDATEQRRLMHSKPIDGWSCTTSTLTPAQAAALKTFYQAVRGQTDAFLWTCDLDDTEYTVRFDSELSRRFSGGTVTCTFELKRLNPEEI